MSEQTILVLDTNSFLRLAGHITPLLNQSFKHPDTDITYNMFIHDDVKNEFSRSSRLKKKFRCLEISDYEFKHWVRLSKEVEQGVTNTVDYLKEYSQEKSLGCSHTDMRCLAIAQMLGHIIVTDDRCMKEVENEFEIEILSTMQLLHLMLQCNRITMEDIKSIVYAWRSIGDLPDNFSRDCNRLFD